MKDQRIPNAGSAGSGSHTASDSAPTQAGSFPQAAHPPPQPDGPDAPPHRPFPDPWHSSPRMAEGETMLMRSESEPQLPLAWLAVLEGPGGKRGTLFTLKSETAVGRTQGDYLLSGDPTISSQHIKIRFEPVEEDVEGDQVFVVYDLASANGTYVGPRETYRDESSRVYRRVLKDGDYLLLGETTLVFKQIV